MATPFEITPELLRQLIRATPETGELFWRKRDVTMFSDCSLFTADQHCRSWNTRHAGNPAFNQNDGHGYKAGRIFQTNCKAHRVMWAIVHGEWPEGDLDHINGDRSDNRISNLRSVDRAGNCRNIRLRSNNSSGVHGVAWRKERKSWRARIKVDGREVALGHFKTFEEAKMARLTAEKEHGFHRNHGRR